MIALDLDNMTFDQALDTLEKDAGIFWKDLPSPVPVMTQDDAEPDVGFHGHQRLQAPRALTRLFSSPQGDLREAYAAVNSTASHLPPTAQHMIASMLLAQNHPKRYRPADDMSAATLVDNLSHSDIDAPAKLRVWKNWKANDPFGDDSDKSVHEYRAEPQEKTAAGEGIMDLIRKLPEHLQGLPAKMKGMVPQGWQDTLGKIPGQLQGYAGQAGDAWGKMTPAQRALAAGGIGAAGGAALGGLSSLTQEEDRRDPLGRMMTGALIGGLGGGAGYLGYQALNSQAVKNLPQAPQQQVETGKARLEKAPYAGAPTGRSVTAPVAPGVAAEAPEYAPSAAAATAETLSPERWIHHPEQQAQDLAYGPGNTAAGMLPHAGGAAAAAGTWKATGPSQFNNKGNIVGQLREGGGDLNLPQDVKDQYRATIDHLREANKGKMLQDRHVYDQLKAHGADLSQQATQQTAAAAQRRELLDHAKSLRAKVQEADPHGTERRLGPTIRRESQLRPDMQRAGGINPHTNRPVSAQETMHHVGERARASSAMADAVGQKPDLALAAKLQAERAKALAAARKLPWMPATGLPEGHVPAHPLPPANVAKITAEDFLRHGKELAAKRPTMGWKTRLPLSLGAGIGADLFGQYLSNAYLPANRQAIQDRFMAENAARFGQ